MKEIEDQAKNIQYKAWQIVVTQGAILGENRFMKSLSALLP